VGGKKEGRLKNETHRGEFKRNRRVPKKNRAKSDAFLVTVKKIPEIALVTGD